jgi:hypothetical protein
VILLLASRPHSPPTQLAATGRRPLAAARSDTCERQRQRQPVDLFASASKPSAVTSAPRSVVAQRSASPLGGMCRMRWRRSPPPANMALDRPMGNLSNLTQMRGGNQIWARPAGELRAAAAGRPPRLEVESGTGWRPARGPRRRTARRRASLSGRRQRQASDAPQSPSITLRLGITFGNDTNYLRRAAPAGRQPPADELLQHNNNNGSNCYHCDQDCNLQNGRSVPVIISKNKSAPARGAQLARSPDTIWLNYITASQPDD